MHHDQRDGETYFEMYVCTWGQRKPKENITINCFLFWSYLTLAALITIPLRSLQTPFPCFAEAKRNAKRTRLWLLANETQLHDFRFHIVVFIAMDYQTQLGSLESMDEANICIARVAQPSDPSFILSKCYPHSPNAIVNPGLLDVIHRVCGGPRAPPPPNLRPELVAAAG